MMKLIHSLGWIFILESPQSFESTYKCWKIIIILKYSLALKPEMLYYSVFEHWEEII